MPRFWTRLRGYYALVLILACYVALGVVYSFATPTFEAPDELRHYMYVKQLTEGLGLPVQTHQGDNPALQEASQPPLYYLLGAAATFWIDSGPIDDVYKPNPQAAIGLPASSGNKNIALHGSEEHFPWHGAVFAVHLLRLLSLLLGLITISATYAIARRLVPSTPHIALSATALAAFVPGFIFISASVNNDNLVSALGALALLLSINTASSRSATKTIILLGIVAGLAAIAKVSGLVALPLILIALALALRHHHSPRRFLRDALIVTAIAVALAGWWYLRNWLLYKDFLGLVTMVSVAGSRPAGFGFLDLVREQEGLRWSFWAVFGVFNIIADRWVYWAYDLLSALALLGLLCRAVPVLARRLRHRLPAPSSNWEGWLLALAWLGMLLVALIKWSLSTMGTQGRLIFPALPAIATLLAVGIASLPIWRPRGSRLLSRALPPGLAILALYLPLTSIVPAYTTPRPITGAQVAAVPNPLHARFANQIELLGYQIDRRAVQPGDDVQITLFWQTLGVIADDYGFFIHVYGSDGRFAGQVDSFPGRGAFATSTLLPGKAYADVYSMHLDAAAAAGLGQIAAGVYDDRTKEPLPAVDGQGQDIGKAVSLGPLRLIPPPGRNELARAQPVHANLGGRVEVIGVRLDDAVIHSGTTLRGELYWRALSPIADNYTVFVHLLDATGTIAQHDAQPLGGDFPTASWSPGDVIGDPFSLAIPKVPAGDYSLVAGMYRLFDGRRLPVDSNPINRLLWRLPFAPSQQSAVDFAHLAVINIR